MRDAPARAARAVGAMFFAGFGTAWLLLWAGDRHPGSAVAPAVVVVLGAALVVAALRVYRAHSAALKALARTPEARRRSRQFNLVNGAQWVAIVIAVSALWKTGLQAWSQPAVILIVGLHFLPLAHLFRYPPHFVTGGALIVLAVTFPFVASGGPESAIGALGTGVVLWISAAFAISPAAPGVSGRLA